MSSAVPLIRSAGNGTTPCTSAAAADEAVL